MEDKERSDRRLSNVYKIDYENLNVAEVMEQVRQKAAKRAAASGGGTSGPEEADEPLAAAPEPAPPAGLKKRIKSKVQRFLTPFFPIQRLLAFPVHEDLMQTVAELHKTNVRLDRLQAKVYERDLSQEYVKLLHILVHNLVAELTKLRIEHEALKMKTRILEKDFEHLGRRAKALEKRLLA